MNGYCAGIAYATGYMANENGKEYLVVRNIDGFYPEQIQAESKYKVYISKHNASRDGACQHVIKARDINTLPAPHEVRNINDFCRAYIEIHGVVDLVKSKRRNGTHVMKPRLRIYGNADIIAFINEHLPAGKKAVQTITNSVGDDYIGKTCAIYYQSADEIIAILDWINGEPKNQKIWEKWEELIWKQS